MTDRKIELTRRRFLGSLVTIGGAGAAAGMGTMAAFSDTEARSGNTVQAGTLDLTLADGQNTSVTFLNESGVVPGDSDFDSLDLNNEGSISADLEISLEAIRSTDKSGNSPGDLENYLEVRGVVELSDGSTEEIFPWQTMSALRGTTLSHGTIPIGDSVTHTFVLHWDLPSSTKNEAKEDSVEIDFGFTLTQSGP